VSCLFSFSTLFIAHAKLNPVQKLYVDSYGRKSSPNIHPGRWEMTMRKMALSSRFSWKCSFLADKSQGLSDQNANMNDSAKGIRKQCVLQSPKYQNKSNQILPQVRQHYLQPKAPPPPIRQVSIPKNKR